jgi:hypothetical protein
MHNATSEKSPHCGRAGWEVAMLDSSWKASLKRERWIWCEKVNYVKIQGKNILGREISNLKVPETKTSPLHP